MKRRLLQHIKVLAIVGMTFLGLANRAWGQQNVCGAGAPTLTPNTSCVTTSYTVASSFTADSPAATSCVTAANNREDGWFQFVATATTSTVTVTANRDVAIAVYSTACPATGAEVACVDAGGSGTTETVTFATTIGTTYYIRIIRFDSGANNNMSGNICVTVPAPPPSNDDCSGATSLTVSSTCSAVSSTNAGATASSGVSAPSCSTYGNNDVWFKFTAPSSNLEINTSAGTMSDAAMSVYSGTCGSLTEIDCDNDAGPGSMPYITSCNFVAGTTYYIRVWGDGGVSGTFSICVNNTGGAASSSTNCAGGATVCSDASFSGNSSGAGAAELTTSNKGCLSTEHQSSWYFFQAQSAGTIQLGITPSNGTDDYDFAIWGPFTSGIPCPPCTTPLRCSWAAGGGTTGLSTSSSDNTEGAGGDKFVAAINASAGQQFVMVIDNYTTSSSPFTLDWTLSAGAALGCTVLPIELTEFTGENLGNRNKLTWKTASETGNDYFTVEKSVDGFNYNLLATVPGAGNSSSVRTYHAFDENPAALNYYRLKQTDFNGHSVYSNVVTVKGTGLENNIGIEVFPVPATEQLNVVFTDEIPDNTVIYLTDLTGRIVLSENLNTESGKKHTLQLAGIHKGVYLLTAESKDLHRKSSIKKIVVE